MNPMAGKEIVYQFNFQCTSTKEHDLTIVNITFHSPPRTVADIKTRIQQVCQIPINLQTILLNFTAPLESNLELSLLGLRNEDILTVRYYSKADCVKIDQCIEWLKSMTQVLTKLGIPGQKDAALIPQEIQKLFDDSQDVLSCLSFKLFLPWMKPESYSNKLYFIDNNGLDLLMELYSLLLMFPWNNLCEDLQLHQCGLIIVLWNLGEMFELRREILKRNGLEMCVQSLIQVPLEGEYNDFTADDVIMFEVIRSAIGTLSNLCELPETHLPIATNQDVIRQLINVCTLGYFDIRTVQTVAILFLVLSYTPSTHTCLLSCDTIESMNITKYTDSSDNDQALFLETSGTSLLFNYHRATYFAQLFCISYKHFTQQQIEIVEDCLTKFISSTTPEELCKEEKTGEYLWETFLPYVKVFFCPPLSHAIPHGESVLTKCLCVNLMALQNMLSRENHRKILKDENLLDYVTCIPWYVPVELHERAKELVNMISTSPDIQLCPPSLKIITKTLIAKSYCGLEDIFKLTGPEIIRKIF